MKTRYSDFIDWYTRSAFIQANKEGKYEDSLMIIKKNHPAVIPNFADFTDMQYFFDFLPEEQTIVTSVFDSDYGSTSRKQFTWSLKSDFIKHLFKTCYNCGWVDIENEYYTALKNILPRENRMKSTLVTSLNNALKHLIDKLEEYLSSLEMPALLNAYEGLFRQEIIKNDLVESFLTGLEYPKKTLLLNFNYTTLLKAYMEKKPTGLSLINVHGQLGSSENPIIFGFGDEMDKDYAAIEMETTDFMRFFKSFGYHMTSNYHDLIGFLDSDLYQVYVLGHSCGLSDRTMLNMIFEHQNCKSVKIFYHKNGDLNNFTDLTMAISRHFHNKGLTRKLVVNFRHSLAMPQWKD
jgi:hypothetical protein